MLALAWLSQNERDYESQSNHRRSINNNMANKFKWREWSNECRMFECPQTCCGERPNHKLMNLWMLSRVTEILQWQHVVIPGTSIQPAYIIPTFRTWQKLRHRHHCWIRLVNRAMPTPSPRPEETVPYRLRLLAILQQTFPTCQRIVMFNVSNIFT